MNLIGNINTIPFRRFRGGGGVVPFPSIPGMIARYSASGLTNEHMKENPVWVDKTGNGHDLQMKNFIWGEMSGVGGYVQNFNYFKNNATVDKVRIDEQSSNSVKVTILATVINAIYILKNIYQFNKSYFIKISSEGYNEGDLSLLFYAPSTSTATTVKVPLNPNGITEIPAIKEDDFLAVYLNVGGKVGSITIEQLPLYPGAIVFDGVDDYGICDNFPILTKEKGYTVVALRQFLGSRNSFLISNRATGTAFSNGAFVFERFWDESGAIFYNFGTPSDQLSLKPDSPFSYLTSKSYNGRATSAGDAVSSNTLLVGKSIINDSNSTNAAVWECVFLDHDATEEELTKIKDYFVKTYPWLFPDQAWTVVGKTNEDEDRATIANITGNGNDLILSNFGFAEGSGYNEQGEYAGYLVTDGVDDKVQSSSFTMNEDWTIVGDWELLSNVQINCGIVKAQNVYLYNIANGLLISINNPRSLQSFGTKSLHAICSDGRLYDRNWVEYEYTVDQNFEIVKSSLNIGFNLNNYTQIAFKNLGIYNNQILSKDDCIKAYNYLQTLKAK